MSAMLIYLFFDSIEKLLTYGLYSESDGENADNTAPICKCIMSAAITFVTSLFKDIRDTVFRQGCI